jgi:hypothetical protein
MAGIKDKSILERWWGRVDYEQLQGMQSRQRMQLFCDRFKNELGYKHAYGWEIYSKEVGGRVMYHMIHASDHDEAPRIMNRAYRNALKDRSRCGACKKTSMRFGATPAAVKSQCARRFSSRRDVT